MLYLGRIFDDVIVYILLYRYTLHLFQRKNETVQKN